MRVREETMMQHGNEESVRTFGIYMSSALCCDSKFQELGIKIEEYIGNLSSTAMMVQLKNL